MKKFASMLYPLLVVLPTMVDGGNTCLSCVDSVIPRDCGNIERCASSEVCFSDVYATALGYVRYDLGCRDVQQCLKRPAVGKRVSSSDQLLKSTCCQGNLCNNASDTHSGYSQPRGPICFNCDTQAHHDSCNRIQVCGVNEKCVLRTKHGLVGLFETGCERETVCNATASIMVGKRDDTRYSRDATCAECCAADLCNDKCLKQGISVSPCAAQPCTNGQCFPKSTSYVCQCNPGYDGSHCEHRQLADQCLSNPCYHGTCSNYGSYYACTCLPGYTGVNCDRSHDLCSSNPCKYGTCYNHGTHYTCACDTGYIGTNCDKLPDPCSSSPCTFGYCVSLSSNTRYECSCTRGYTGTHCDQAITTTDHCNPDPCVHGTCHNHNDKFTCVCRRGYSGTTCDTVGVV